MKASQIPPFALDSYQRAARVVLANHLVTRTYPDRVSLPLIRLWATELRDDLADLFGYRLEVTETTARLFPVVDRLDASQPARSAADRTFDRRRYAYLALAIATLGRARDQITLSELAALVAADAAVMPSLDLNTEKRTDRDAFVDAVGWLASRGAIVVTDGDASGWASDPTTGEALYDIDRTIVAALFRPSRALQHLRSVAGLVTGPDDDARAAARRVRRALVQRPVVYHAELDEPQGRQLSAERAIADVELLTGLHCERRAEGVALIDTSGRFSDVRFPGTGTIAQVALLLAGEIADYARSAAVALPYPDRNADLARQLDASIPAGSVYDELADAGQSVSVVESADDPFVADSWLAATITDLTELYGKTFAAGWQADPAGLRAEAVALLERLRLVARVDGGVVALPAIARYGGVVATVREREAVPTLFAALREESA